MNNYTNYIILKDGIRTYEKHFDEHYKNKWFDVLDKERIATKLGRKIIEEKSNIEINKNNFENYELLNLIDEEYLNDIRCEIYDMLEEYLANNS